MTPGNTVNTVSVKDLAAVLARRKRQILITFFLVVAGVVAGTLLMPKQYETRMKILVKNERADVIVSADRNNSSGCRGEVSEVRINSEIELLTSKTCSGKSSPGAVWNSSSRWPMLTPRGAISSPSKRPSSADADHELPSLRG